MVMDATKRKNQEKHAYFSKIGNEVSRWATKALTGAAKAGHRFLRETTKVSDYIVEASGFVAEP